MNRKRNIGETVLQRKMLKNMSDAIFQQDGAPAHNAKITQDWLRGKIDKFSPGERDLASQLLRLESY